MKFAQQGHPLPSAQKSAILQPRKASVDFIISVNNLTKQFLSCRRKVLVNKGRGVRGKAKFSTGKALFLDFSIKLYVTFCSTSKLNNSVSCTTVWNRNTVAYFDVTVYNSFSNHVSNRLNNAHKASISLCDITFNSHIDVPRAMFR